MAHVSCHALLIDPDPTTAAQLQQLLAQASTGTNSFVLRLDVVATLEAGLQSLAPSQSALMPIQGMQTIEPTHPDPYHLLLLEMGVFHEFSVQQKNRQQGAKAERAEGSPTLAFERSVAEAGEWILPIIVVSQQDNEALAQEAIEGGAYGYLLMPQLTLKGLHYTAWAAMQRHQQLMQLLQTTPPLTRDLEGWDQMAQQRSSPRLTAQLFDAGSLRETLPDFFRELVDDYARALDLALERRAYRVQASEENVLRSLAEQLGFLKAGPRDVVEMHTQALRQKTQNAVPEKAQAYLAESRLTVLEVMGDLVSYYRRYCMGISQMKARHRRDSS